MDNLSLEYLNQYGIIGLIVFVQAIMLFFGIIATGLFLIGRAIWTKHRLSKEDEFNKILIEFLFESNTSKLNSLKLEFWQTTIFRDVILHQIRLLSGQERDELIGLYTRAGFLKKDRNLLHSRSWGVRLSSLIRMDLLLLPENREAFVHSMSDQHPLVALCATRAISRLPVEIDDELLFSTLVRVGGRRREAAIEVLSNIGTNSGLERIISYLEKNPESPIAVACVVVLGDLRAVEASNVFLQIMNSPELFSDELITEVLQGLRKIADPAGLALAMQTLRHSSPRVRATSIYFIQEVGGSFSTEDLQTLNEDLSVEVRRAMQFIASQRQAA